MLDQRPVVENAARRVRSRRENAAHEREAVRVQPRGRYADKRVAGDDIAAVDDRVFLDDADAEPREIVFVRRVHARMLGRLSTDQRRPRELAAVSNARHDASRDVHVEPRRAEVIQKKQRLGAQDDDVVGAHRDQVDAHLVVRVVVDSKLQLRADAVGSGD